MLKLTHVSGHSHGYGVYHHHAHYAYEPIPSGNNYTASVLEGDEAVLRCRLKEPAGRKVRSGCGGLREQRGQVLRIGGSSEDRC